VARVVRGSVLVIRETAYVEAARALGAADATLIGRHVLPNCLSPVIVQGSFVFAAAVLTEAALSFLGVGVPPFVPSWGNILSDGRLYLQQAPWLVLYPGAAIMMTILGLNLFGDGLRDLLDPKLAGDSVQESRGLQTQRVS
jgi:peptide/nickel transport system permease protein